MLACLLKKKTFSTTEIADLKYEVPWHFDVSYKNSELKPMDCLDYGVPFMCLPMRIIRHLVLPPVFRWNDIWFICDCLLQRTKQMSQTNQVIQTYALLFVPKWSYLLSVDQDVEKKKGDANRP